MSTHRRQQTALSLLLIVLSPIAVLAQTFRGAINGTVTDQSGAVVSGAAIEAVNAGTSVSLKTVSSSAGEFTFLDLPVGSYNISITASGFRPERVQSVPVSAGSTYTLPVKLGIASTGETVEVSASALSLDTTTTVQTTDIPSQTVQNTPMNGRDFTQLVAVTPGYAGYAGGGYGSVNGSRPDMINWQIEGADNNDVWWNIPAANQGGISGIAGVTLPLDAIEQVSIVTEAGPDIGRSPGATVNLAIKSGTNGFHGSAYYYNRNEALAAKSALSVTKPELRNQQFGGSVGGPIIRDKFFFFVSYEEQKFIIGVNQPSTEPSFDYVCGAPGCSASSPAVGKTSAAAILQQYGVPVNQTSLNLLYGSGSNQGLWPSSVLVSTQTAGLAQAYNYLNPENEIGFSHNGLVHFDYSLDENDKLAFRWYVGQGPQIAPTTSLLTPYYEVGPMHVQSFSLTYNKILTQRITNQVFMGINYFNQSFSDASTDYNPIGLGLNTGATAPSLAGAPRIQIAAPTASSGLGSSSDGFDFVGATVDSGRNDITGHLNESLSWTVGKHELHFGGEYRQAQIDDFYQADQRGTFVFDGTQGPWSKDTTVSDRRFLQLADFLAGYMDPGTTSIVQGDPKRQVFIDSWGAFAQDTFQLQPNFTLNYGLRYEYNGPIHSPYNILSTFVPGAGTDGLAVAGETIPFLYPRYYGGFGPRVGFSWQPPVDSKAVVRGGFGLGYDNPNIVNFLNSRFSANGGAFGVQDNPAGAVQTADTGPIVNPTTGLAVIPSGGAAIFPNALSGACIDTPSALDPSCSNLNVFSISQHLRSGYVENYNFNVQQSIGRNVVAQVGYVGSSARRLRTLLDINQAAVGSGSNTSVSSVQTAYGTVSVPFQQTTRPFYSEYPNYAIINQVNSNGVGNYNSLQATLRVASWHGLTSEVAYTYGHSLDELSQIYLYNPQNSQNLRGEYGNSDFDVRHTLVSYGTYELPAFSHGPKLLTNGWQVNGLVNFHGGQPFTVYSSNQGSATGENADRANRTPGINPNTGISKNVAGNATSGYSVNWTPTAYTPTVNDFGDSHRNDLHGPGFSDVDLSVFKNTKIGEAVTAQFRVEMFNVFNRLNLAQPGDGYCSDTDNGANTSSCAIATTIGANYGAPGIGAGEPFNTQLALKIIF